jgi:hypothetical protein
MLGYHFLYSIVFLTIGFIFVKQKAVACMFEVFQCLETVVEQHYSGPNEIELCIP